MTYAIGKVKSVRSRTRRDVVRSETCLNRGAHASMGNHSGTVWGHQSFLQPPVRGMELWELVLKRSCPGASTIGWCPTEWGLLASQRRPDIALIPSPPKVPKSFGALKGRVLSNRVPFAVEVKLSSSEDRPAMPSWASKIRDRSDLESALHVSWPEKTYRTAMIRYLTGCWPYAAEAAYFSMNCLYMIVDVIFEWWYRTRWQ